MSVATENTETFASLNPATGEVVAEHPVQDAAAVAAAVERAREAAAWWRALGWKERRLRLLNVKGSLTRNLGRMAELIHQETGKPVQDAQLETIMAITHLDWAARNAQKVLGPRSVYPGLMAINQRCVLEYQPLGVVGVIGPWNYPVFTPMGSIAYALAAGNAVVFKPSEYTPGVGVLLAELVDAVIPEHPVLQTVTGLGETGAALASSPHVGKIAFTGSARTAKRVMAACAENLTPIVAECGGKDACIVDSDADLDAAADAALWGAMSNAGQTCIGVERIYVVDEAYDKFLGTLTEKARDLRPGFDREAAYGPITMPSQLDVIERHIKDALAKGGRAVVGGAESVRKPYVEPVVLTNVPDDSSAVCEETFGPTITVHRVKDMDEAVEKANKTSYGLAGTIFSGDKSRAMETARRMRSGMTSINAFAAFASVAALPFGGVGESGFGRIHGADGLREFARPKAITRQRFATMNLTSFARSEKEMARVLGLINMIHGRRYKR
ncbi:aldehyde dehydrogenase family protein [Actinomadura madurae]|uniref:aldehyde dehydrogenase family protein n=1 Tax=Actinomadura madurae TaxID=1993 RepID=UPI00202750B1|nr:aldehyde dehydrogenase family protein [Actinomadura madurae]MCP9953625.1 aldehyde dehydrogenase family protein [Actinomadura madurae]MCP9970379.1 aldehyde dehydrogenase family protein [Actinomadura madurae]MCP9982861.1 aldehyde dehydrogenase family protein [Actinomadura madurae]MCQ0005588.1 aldehyde dehydrogenase family protein [Actinomadura madurae]MCQ0019094.1 aldehyde dehydrogenase family protein [Actinomadura madurae]